MSYPPEIEKRIRQRMELEKAKGKPSTYAYTAPPPFLTAENKQSPRGFDFKPNPKYQGTVDTSRPPLVQTPSQFATRPPFPGAREQAGELALNEAEQRAALKTETPVLERSRPPSAPPTLSQAGPRPPQDEAPFTLIKGSGIYYGDEEGNQFRAIPGEGYQGSRQAARFGNPAYAAQRAQRAKDVTAGAYRTNASANMVDAINSSKQLEFSGDDIVASFMNPKTHRYEKKILDPVLADAASDPSKWKYEKVPMGDLGVETGMLYNEETAKRIYLDPEQEQQMATVEYALKLQTMGEEAARKAIAAKFGEDTAEGLE